KQRVLRQRQHHRPRPSRAGGMERVAHVFRDALDAVDLADPLRHLAVHAAIVDFLERLALGELVRHLADEHHHRRRVLLRGVHADRAVGRAGAARDEQDAGLAGQLAVGLRHVRGAAFLAADDEREALALVVHAVEHRQVALARHAECELGALGDQGIGQDLSAVAGLEVGFHPAIISTMDDINTLRRILRESKTIAVVGLSADWFRPSYFAAKYMQEHGYRFIPVNPKYPEILGEKCYKSLRDIPGKVDLVDIFRKTQDVMPIAEEAIAIGAKVLWQQLGVKNEAAAAKARAAGLEAVMDRCVKIEHGRLFGGLNWVGVNTRVISAKRPRWLAY